MSAVVHEQRQFSLTRALGLSVLLHLVLLLLSPWTPLTRTEALEPLQEPNEITFSFLDEPSEEDDRPAQDVPPKPSDPQPAVESEPVPAVDEEVVPDLTAEETTARIDEADPQPAEEQTAGESDAEPAPLEPTESDAAAEAAADEERQPAEDAPAGADGQGEADPRKLDVRQALQDFRRSMSRRPPPSSPGPSEPRNVVVPDLSSIPRSGFGMGNLTFESRDYDWNDYGRQIYMAIWRAWHNRLWMTTDDFERWAHETGIWYLQHDSQVRFVIESNGQVTGIVLEQGSGCPALDASAVDALAEVILPPLPADFPRDQEVVHARFAAVGRVRDMRPTLRRMKSLGMF